MLSDAPTVLGMLTCCGNYGHIGLDIVDVYDATMSGVYVFEMKKVTNLRGAVAFARKTLLQDAAVKGYNVFLSEGYVFPRRSFPRMR